MSSNRYPEEFQAPPEERKKPEPATPCLDTGPGWSDG